MQLSPPTSKILSAELDVLPPTLPDQIDWDDFYILELHPIEVARQLCLMGIRLGRAVVI